MSKVLKGRLWTDGPTEMWFELHDTGFGKIKILDQRLFEFLITEVPCRVGGPYLYSEEAILEGIMDARGASHPTGNSGANS